MKIVTMTSKVMKREKRVKKRTVLVGSRNALDIEWNRAVFPQKHKF